MEIFIVYCYLKYYLSTYIYYLYIYNAMLLLSLIFTLFIFLFSNKKNILKKRMDQYIMDEN